MKGKHRNLDRISALPQDTIEKILTLMPLRDALRTSILSRKWRYTWTTIPKLVFDDDILTVLYYGEDFNKYKFVNPIFHVLLLHKGPILEFSLCVTDTYTDKEISNEIDQIILYLSMNNNIKKFILNIWRGDNNYLLPCSLFSFQQLEHLDVSYCTFKPPSVNKGFSMLKSLRFYEVSVTNNMFFKFLTNCPLLEEFIWTKEGMDINLSECEFVELFKCLPSVQVLELSPLFIKHLAVGGMPHKLPISLPHLRTLVLGVCFLELSTVLCVINSSPNLEKIKVGICGRHDPGCRFQKTYVYLPNIQDYSEVKLDHLKELEVTNFHNDLLETEFVKLIMANSPMLKRARIEVSSYIYVGEHVRMLRGLVNTPFPRASPAVRFTVEEVEETDD